MAITVTCPNPNCGQACSVKDEHAGMKVSCPKCGGVIQVPAAANPTAQPLPVAGGAPPIVGGFGGAGFMVNLQTLAGTPLAKTLLLAGLGCLVGVVLLILIFVARFGAISFDGLLWILVSLGAVGFVCFAILQNRADLYNISVYVAAGWSATIGVWQLIIFFRFIRLGFDFIFFLALLASLGAAGCFGYLTYQKIMKK